MDKLPKLKQIIINKFSDLVRRSQRGYPFDGYDIVMKAMYAVNFLENFTLLNYQAETIIDLYIRKLTQL